MVFDIISYILGIASVLAFLVVGVLVLFVILGRRAYSEYKTNHQTETPKRTS